MSFDANSLPKAIEASAFAAKIAQQSPTRSQAELPWKKYEREDVPDLPTEQVARQDKVRRKRDAARSRETLERERELEQREVGFSSRLLVQATLPHSEPNIEESTEFERSNGYVKVRIQARREFGFPYGTYPRLLLSWITTEAVRTKSPDLVLGDSLSEFMKGLGLTVAGGAQGPIGRLRNHMQRLFSATVSATYQDAGRWQNFSFCPVEKTELFWDPKNPEQSSLWHSNISLNKTFFEEIVRKPVPLDMGTLKALAKTRSPMAIDIYAWLTYRFSYLSDPVLIPWARLKDQFGCDYSREDHFRASFKRHLVSVKEHYPDARFELRADGLRLYASRPHVRLLRA